MESKVCSCGKTFNLVPGRDQDRCKECVIGHRPAQVRQITRQAREAQKTTEAPAKSSRTTKKKVADHKN
jgi:Zn-finger protein